eukprot:2891188-Amphidinium_carterae.1
MSVGSALYSLGLNEDLVRLPMATNLVSGASSYDAASLTLRAGASASLRHRSDLDKCGKYHSNKTSRIHQNVSKQGILQNHHINRLALVTNQNTTSVSQAYTGSANTG